jgi:hypothetical protein
MRTSGDASEDPPGDGPGLGVEHVLAAVVAALEHLTDEGAVVRRHRRPVERLVGQRFRIEVPQRVGVADDLDQGGEQVHLRTGELVSGQWPEPAVRA